MLFNTHIINFCRETIHYKLYDQSFTSSGLVGGKIIDTKDLKLNVYFFLVLEKLNEYKYETFQLFSLDLIGQYRFFDTQIVVNGGIPLGTSYQTRQIVVSYFLCIIVMLCIDFICIISFSRSTYLQRLLKISSPTLNTFLSTCTLDLPICSSHTFIFNLKTE